MDKIKQAIREYKKKQETPEIREWKRKWNKFYYSYMIAVGNYKSGLYDFQAFMEEIKRINKEWKNG